MYKVELAPSLRQLYAKASRPLASKLERCFRQLEVDPHRHNNIKPLKGPFSGLLRYRIGDHRVVYEINERKKIVSVVHIAHRSDVYE